MKLSITLRVLFFTPLLCLSLPLEASGQQKKEWTWKDSKGNVMWRADLDEILRRHARWLESNQNPWARDEDMGLKGADLRGADVHRADLCNAELSGADLRGANLNGADLSYANLYKADLSGAFLNQAHLTRATLAYAHLSRAFLHDADLSGAGLNNADLKYAALDGAVLTGANLDRVDLTGARLAADDLSGAHLNGTDLTGAVVWDVDLKSASFQANNPTLQWIAMGRNLELMRYDNNPVPLTELRKRFQDAGYRDQERAITCVLNRHDADPALLRLSLDNEFGRILRPSKYGWRRPMPFNSFVQGAFKWIAFDLTCQYGLTPGRPLRIVLWLWLVFAGVYAVLMHRSGPSGIYFIGSRLWRGRSNTQGMQIRPRAIRPAKWWKIPFFWLRREWRVLRAAMFFSLMSAFNIGFRDINFGRWLRMLTKREYDLKAVGWARTVSGFQSLLSVYLIALWVLTYFGRPFG